MDELREFRHQIDDRGEGYFLHLNGETTFGLIEASAKASALAAVDRCLELLQQKAEVFDEIDRSRLTPHEWDVWISPGGSGAAESIHRCIRTGAVLWTDDAALAGFGATRGVRSMCTQTLLEAMMTKGGVNESDWLSISARLIGLRFVSIRVLPAMYVAAAQLAGWVATRWPLRQHLDLFRNAPWERKQLVALGVNVLRELWRNRPSEHDASILTMTMLDNIHERESGISYVRLIGKAIRPVFGLDALNADECQNVVDAWLRFADGLVPVV